MCQNKFLKFHWWSLRVSYSVNSIFSWWRYAICATSSGNSNSRTARDISDSKWNFFYIFYILLSMRERTHILLLLFISIYIWILFPLSFVLIEENQLFNVYWLIRIIIMMDMSKQKRTRYNKKIVCINIKAIYEM